MKVRGHYCLLIAYYVPDTTPRILYTAFFAKKSHQKITKCMNTQTQEPTPNSRDMPAINSLRQTALAFCTYLHPHYPSNTKNFKKEN